MKYFSLTDVGKKREKNEDGYFSAVNNYNGVDIGIFIVADGMGGYEKGEFASESAIKCVRKCLKDYIKDFDLKSISLKTVQHFIQSSIEFANLVIYENTQKGKNMGTTMVLGIIYENNVIFGNVGDSRAYIIRDDQITQITKDNSYVQHLIEEGLISEQEARNHRDKNKITKAVGFEESINVDFYDLKIQKNDRILLCSDGLTSMVTDEKIKQIINSNDDIKISSHELLNEANNNGGKDNITITLVEI